MPSAENAATMALASRPLGSGSLLLSDQGDPSPEGWRTARTDGDVLTARRRRVEKISECCSRVRHEPRSSIAPSGLRDVYRPAIPRKFSGGASRRSCVDLAGGTCRTTFIPISKPVNPEPGKGMVLDALDSGMGVFDAVKYIDHFEGGFRSSYCGTTTALLAVSKRPRPASIWRSPALGLEPGGRGDHSQI